MLKPTIFSILLAAGTFTASAKYVTKISGTVDISLGTDTVMVIEDSAHPFFDRKWIIPVTDGKFSQEIETDHPMACYFIPMNQIRWWSYNWRFIADGGDVNVTATKMGDEPTAVLDFSGPLSVKLRDFAISLYESPEAVALQSFADSVYAVNGEYQPEYRQLYIAAENEQDREKVKRLNASMDSLAALGLKDSEDGRIISEGFKALRKKGMVDKINFIAGDTSYVGLYLIAQLMWTSHQHSDSDIDKVIEIYTQRYTDVCPGHPYHAELKAAVEVRNSGGIKVGGKYIDVEALDADGKMKKISTVIDGKVAIIDLWASWCSPCRRNSIAMKPIYERFAPEGLAIVGIGREMENDAAMRKAVKKDGYPWVTLAEINDGNYIWAKYGTASAPGRIVLVDHEGTIVAIDPSIEELERLIPGLLEKMNVRQ